MPKHVLTYSFDQNFEDFSGSPEPVLEFHIRVKDVFGQESVSGVTTCTNASPSAPTGLSAEAFLETIMLTWTAHSETDLSHFKLYRNTSNTFATATCISQRIPAYATSFIDKNVQSGTFYYWLSVVDVYDQESSPSTVVSIRATMSLLDLELMKIMFTTVSWAQFCVFESFNDETKRVSPDPSTYDAEVGGGWLDNGGDDTINRSLGFVSKTYTSVTTIDSGTSTDVGSGYLEDTSENWYDTQYNNLTLVDSESTEFTINSTVDATDRLEVTGTPAAGAYSVKTADPSYVVGLCTFLDSTNGGYGYTKLEASFDNGGNWLTILDTENSIDLRGGVLSVTNTGHTYIVRATIKNDASGDGAIMYKFMVFTDPSVWVSTA